MIVGAKFFGGLFCLGLLWSSGFFSSIQAQELIPVGAPQAIQALSLEIATADRIRRDAEERAIVEARFIRELYTQPDILFRDFPALEALIRVSPYYRPDYWIQRAVSPMAQRPSIHLSGGDYYPVGPNEYVLIEHNTTNVGGLIELWRMKRPGMEEMIKHFLASVRSKSHQPNGLSLYFVEETSYGLPWKEFRELFRQTFGWEMVSGVEIHEGRFRVEDKTLFYKKEDGSEEPVANMIVHFEPDILSMADLPQVRGHLLQLVPEEKIADLELHTIPGFLSVLLAGNITVVNEPGHDIACAKLLLPFMPELRKRYLGEGAFEIVPTMATEIFVDERGQLIVQKLRAVIEDPTAYVIKDHRMIGGGDGVFILREMSAADRAILFTKVLMLPQAFLLQRLQPAHLTPGGYRVEVRTPTAVMYDPQTGVAGVIASSPSFFARGASRGKANLGVNLGSDADRFLSEEEALGTKSFVVRVDISGCDHLLARVQF